MKRIIEKMREEALSRGFCGTVAELDAALVNGRAPRIGESLTIVECYPRCVTRVVTVEEPTLGMEGRELRLWHSGQTTAHWTGMPEVGVLPPLPNDCVPASSLRVGKRITDCWDTSYEVTRVAGDVVEFAHVQYNGWIDGRKRESGICRDPEGVYRARWKLGQRRCERASLNLLEAYPDDIQYRDSFWVEEHLIVGDAQ